jgi:hypothetical protein
MACPTFTVTVKDVKAALAKVKKAIAEAKGSFSGDETKGSYSVSGDGFISGSYTIKGSYTVTDKNIAITNDITAENPRLVTCKAVEDKVKAWLK